MELFPFWSTVRVEFISRSNWTSLHLWNEALAKLIDFILLLLLPSLHLRHTILLLEANESIFNCLVRVSVWIHDHSDRVSIQLRMVRLIVELVLLNRLHEVVWLSVSHYHIHSVGEQVAVFLGNELNFCWLEDKVALLILASKCWFLYIMSASRSVYNFLMMEVLNASCKVFDIYQWNVSVVSFLIFGNCIPYFVYLFLFFV